MAWFRRFAGAASLAVSGAVCVTCEAAAAENTGSVLYCRGGGQMTASVAHESDEAGRVTGSAILIRFVASRRPAIQRVPNIGECTYFDRIMGQGESRLLMLRAPGASVDFTIQPNGAATGIQPRGPRKQREQMRRILDAVTNAEPFQVRVETRGTGPKRVTNIER
jgi:hypothetical protein